MDYLSLKWWKRKYSVCIECGVHFEPVTGYEARWGTLCAMHRKVVKERDEKRDAVVAWARTNWERLAPQMDKEIEALKAAYNSGVGQAALSQAAAHQNLSALDFPYKL